MKAKIVNSGEAFDVVGRFPTVLLSKLAPGLFVDVGAALGLKAGDMLAASPGSRVIAYEPFAGNVRLLDELAQADPRLTVRPVAVAEKSGSAKLYVASLVPAGLSTEGRTGGSVVGQLRPARASRDLIIQDVPLVRLDDEIREPVRFLKLDVQGSEIRVLNGAKTLIDTIGVDYIYAEFNGDIRLLHFLDAHGYVLFDSLYLAWRGRLAPRNLLRDGKANAPRGWQVVEELVLGTGAHGLHVWPKVPFRRFALYCAWFAFTRLFVCGLQTDILAVHRSQLAAFARICVQAKAEARAGKARAGAAH